MKAPRLLALLIAGVLLAGCGSSANTVSVKNASRLVLADQDLPKVFSSFNSGPLASLDTQGTNRADPSRFGRKGGWVARYHRAGSKATRGPLVVESRADVFGSAGGAKSDLGAYNDQFDRIPGAGLKRVPMPKLGDAALGVTFLQPGLLPVRFYRFAWRDRNVTASLTVDGFAGKLTLPQALDLARKQERRIARQK